AVGFLNVRAGGIYIDGTCGAGGPTRAILTTPGAQVIGIDRDRAAVAGGFDLVEASEGRLTLVEDRFSRLDEIAREFGHSTVDGVLLDLGVSSMQLDEAGRGFSFRRDGPLDMPMGSEGPECGRCRGDGVAPGPCRHYRDARRGAPRACGRPCHRRRT